MRRRVWTFAIATAAVIVAGSAVAAGLTVGLNESRRVLLRGAAANVVVENSAIADVAMTDAHSVIVMGKGYGVTHIQVTDHAGRTLMDDRVVVVGGDEGRVTIFRGQTAAMDFNCSNRCQTFGPTVASASTSSPAPMAAAAPPPPSAPGLPSSAPVTITPAAGGPSQTFTPLPP